jgi:glycosyltransferase involved in cell wall biosynthesis
MFSGCWFGDSADPRKVKLIPHGFEFSYFRDVGAGRISNMYRKYKISPENKPVIGVIARFTEWKGVQFVIPAFEKLRVSFPHAHLVLANAHGDYEASLNSLLSRLPPSSYTKIAFETDLAALYRLFDLFVHVPTDAQSEAFGQTYIEPLIVGIPCIFTLSGIAPEVIVQEKNALVVDFENWEQIHDSMLRLLNDCTLRESLSKNGKKSVERFTMDYYLSDLKDLYLR